MEKANNKKKHDNNNGTSQTLPLAVSVGSSQSCEVVNINGQLVAFCQTTDFATYVRKAINNEMFWRDILQQYSISSMVQNELNNKLPAQVKSETLLVVNKMVSEQNTKVSEQLDNYTRIQIPSHVAKALQDQITGYLNNNVQMTQILSQHSANLNQNLYDSANRILTDVVNDPQHYKLASQHIEIQNLKCSSALIEQNKRFSENLVSHNGQVNEYLKKVNDRVSLELKNVTEANQKVEEQNKKITKQQDKINKLEQHIGSLQMYFGILVAVSGIAFTGIGYLMTRR